MPTIGTLASCILSQIEGWPVYAVPGGDPETVIGKTFVGQDFQETEQQGFQTSETRDDEVLARVPSAQASIAKVFYSLNSLSSPSRYEASGFKKGRWRSASANPSQRRDQLLLVLGELGGA